MKELAQQAQEMLELRLSAAQLVALETYEAEAGSVAVQNAPPKSVMPKKEEYKAPESKIDDKSIEDAGDIEL